MGTTSSPAERSAVPHGSQPEAVSLARLAIPLDRIDVADNVRTTTDPEADAALLAGVTARGVLEPVGVTLQPDGRYLLRYGHRRLWAAGQAGLVAIPAVLVDDDPDTRVLDQLVENVHRSALNPMEIARAAQRMLDERPGLTRKALAAELGCDPSTLSNTLGLLKAPAEVQQLVEDGSLSRAHAVAIKGLPADLQVKEAQEAAAVGLPSGALERRAAEQRARQADLDRRTNRSEALALAGLAALDAAGVEKGTTLTVRAPWDVDTMAVAAAITAAGHAIHDRWGSKPTEGCDCTALELSFPEGKPTIEPTCVSGEHRQAAWEVQDAQRSAAAAVKTAERQALVAAAAVAIRAEPGRRSVRQLLLRALEGGAGRTWTEYSALTDQELSDQLAERMFPPAYMAPHPLPSKVLAALTAAAPEPEAVPA